MYLNLINFRYDDRMLVHNSWSVQDDYSIIIMYAFSVYSNRTQAIKYNFNFCTIF